MSKSVLWHQFRARPRKNTPPFPTAQCVDYLASELSLREYGFRVSQLIFVLDTESIYSFLESKQEYDNFGKALVEKMLHERVWLTDVVAWAQEHKNDLRNYARVNLTTRSIKPLSNADLAQRYIEYHEIYRAIHLKNTPPWWVGADALSETLGRRLRSELPPNVNPDEIFLALSAGPEYITEQGQEEESLLRLAADVHAAKVRDIDSLPPEIGRQLVEHEAEFSHIPFGYNTGLLWDRSYFVQRLKAILVNESFERDPHEDLEKKLNERLIKKNERDRLENSLNLSADTRHLFNCLRLLGYLQDLKKTAQVRSHPILILEAQPEIARRLKINPLLLQYLSYEETANHLSNGKMAGSELKNISARLGSPVALVMKNLRTNWLIGRPAAEMLREYVYKKDEAVIELKGAAAAPGIVRGIVRLVKTSTELAKVQVGEVLVTAMTTPDFVPAMKKASAIITDEGGITCHAAIVSRELNIPCVIGTKIATKVLQDGDLVEVDANTGRVKILKKLQ